MAEYRDKFGKPLSVGDRVLTLPHGYGNDKIVIYTIESLGTDVNYPETYMIKVKEEENEICVIEEVIVKIELNWGI